MSDGNLTRGVPAAPVAKRGFAALASILTPNRSVNSGTTIGIIFFWMVLVLFTWFVWPIKIIPRPLEVLRAFAPLFRQDGLLQELATSMSVNVEALTLTAVLSLGLAYLTPVPIMRAPVLWVSKARFLGLSGLVLFFTLLLPGSHALKVALLTFSMTVFFVTSMADVVASIPEERFDHARTLRMGEWHVTFEVVVLGTMDKALEVLRQNAAMGWMMLTMVEGLVRSEGGVGTMLLNQDKYLHLDKVYAIQVVILGVGLLQDFLIVFIKDKILCPWANLTLARR